MNLESLKSEMFAKMSLSKEALRLINGGAKIYTSYTQGNNKGTDTDTYSRCGTGNQLYDVSTKYDFGSTVNKNQKEMWPGTVAEDYK